MGSLFIYAFTSVNTVYFTKKSDMLIMLVCFLSWVCRRDGTTRSFQCSTCNSPLFSWIPKLIIGALGSFPVQTLRVILSR